MIEGGGSKIYNSKSRTFLTFCFSFILGVGIFSWLPLNRNYQFYLYLLIWLLILGRIFFGKSRLNKFIVWCLVFFIFGGMRFYYSVPNDKDGNNLNYYNNQRVNFEGIVSEEVLPTANSSQVIVSARSIFKKPISGRVLISMPVYTDLEFGDVVKVYCELKSPVGSEQFINYDKYLARQGIWSVCSGKIRIEKLGRDSSWIVKIVAWFYQFKIGLQNRIDQLWIEPHSALVAGLLYGARHNLGDLALDFKQVGLTHIVAISGYNISIITSVFLITLSRFGLRRRTSFYIVVSGVIIFVLFTGASASVVRAGIMGIIVLLATQLGRLSQVANVIILAAVLMLLFNPFVLIWDVGFQLSFLSTSGLIYLSPLMKKYFSFPLSNIIVQNLSESLVSTLSAIIATLPLILFQFGYFSLIAPLANLLILWIIPFLMALSFISIILSYIFYPLGSIGAYITYLGLEYVIIITHQLARWPFSSVKLHFPFWLMTVLYGFLVYLVYKNIIKTNKVYE